MIRRHNTDVLIFLMGVTIGMTIMILASMLILNKEEQNTNKVIETLEQSNDSLKLELDKINNIKYEKIKAIDTMPDSLFVEYFYDLLSKQTR